MALAGFLEDTHSWDGKGGPKGVVYLSKTNHLQIKKIVPMNRPLQIKTIRRMIRAANPDLDENFETNNLLPNYKGRYVDWTKYVGPYDLHVSVWVLENLFPNVIIRRPKTPKKGGPLKYRRSGSTLYAYGEILVCRLATVDKRKKLIESGWGPQKHVYGRIQIPVHEELIGIKAEVRIKFPNAPKIKERGKRENREKFRYRHFSREDLKDLIARSDS